jgi:hypothetical protein
LAIIINVNSTYLHFEVIEQVFIFLGVIQVKEVILDIRDPLLRSARHLLLAHCVFKPDQFFLKASYDFHFASHEHFRALDVFVEISG